MSDFVPDTPVIGRTYCPACEPEADPLSEILETRYCALHGVAIEGSEDSGVVALAYMSGSQEAGGHDNARWCEFIHRAVTPE